jgi:HAD superfamily hydrolase (TIGR01509 family)
VTSPLFFYFDLGNVLLFFDQQRAARQLAAAAGCEPERVYDLVFRSDLNHSCDGGLVAAGEFCKLFREATGCAADDATLHRASSDIFRINAPMKAIVSQLRAAGHRLGILSNTCDMHFDFFSDGRYAPIPAAFEVVVLSYKLKLMKPQPEIYLEAARLAGVEPREVFYVDDLAVNVEGAKRVGFDAVQYTTPAAYAAELRRRGVKFNY